MRPRCPQTIRRVRRRRWSCCETAPTARRSSWCGATPAPARSAARTSSQAGGWTPRMSRTTNGATASTRRAGSSPICFRRRRWRFTSARRGSSSKRPACCWPAIDPERWCRSPILRTSRRFKPYRHDVHAHRRTLREILEREGLRLALDPLTTLRALGHAAGRGPAVRYPFLRDTGAAAADRGTRRDRDDRGRMDHSDRRPRRGRKRRHACCRRQRGSRFEN